MNERIKMLKHQASVWCDENIPDQFSEETNGYGKAWEDKFAELIVRECADVLVAEMNRLDGLDRVVASQTMDTAQVLIKEHFGVEE